MPQHNDLEVLGAAGTYGKPDETEHEDVQSASHHLIVGLRSRRSTAAAEFPAPTRFALTRSCLSSALMGAWELALPAGLPQTVMRRRVQAAAFCGCGQSPPES